MAETKHVNPDMVAALEARARLYERELYYILPQGDAQALIATARAAVAKAKGGDHG